MNAQTKIAMPAVYQKIADVQGALARNGIGKDRTNSSPGGSYKFRGIDDVYNALAPLLAEHGLCILPRIIRHTLTERGKTAKGNPIFSAVVDAEFDFVAADDGSTHTIRTVGEAMDSSDKATNKAMSAAYKYAAFMAFAIPTEGDNDADAHTPELAPRQDDRAIRPKGEGPMKTHLDQAEKAICRELSACGDEAMLVGYLGTDEYKSAKALLEEHRPSALYGPAPPDCPEYVPIKARIAAMVREFRAADGVREQSPVEAG